MDSSKAFKEKLDNEHKWPTTYMFKFVVPSAKVSELKAILSTETLQTKTSKNGKYVSFTLKKYMKSSDEVVDIYMNTRKIEGLIAL
jgi:putative lipoic acid-binding regulatory protein